MKARTRRLHLGIQGRCASLRVRIDRAYEQNNLQLALILVDRLLQRVGYKGFGL